MTVDFVPLFLIRFPFISLSEPNQPHSLNGRFDAFNLEDAVKKFHHGRKHSVKSNIWSCSDLAENLELGINCEFWSDFLHQIFHFRVEHNFKV